MFHVTRNGPERGTSNFELLTGFEDAVRAALPQDWIVEELREPRLDDTGQWPDALYRLAVPTGEVGAVLTMVKDRQVDPRDLPVLLNQMRLFDEAIAPAALVLIAPFLTRLAQERLEEAGVGWFDTTGNLRLRLDRPAVFISNTGASRSPFVDPSDRRLKSLRGPAAARITRGLCEFPLPLGVRSFAQRANVGPASSSRVLELLGREGLITREEAGTVVSVRKRALLQRWTDDYRLTDSNDVTAVQDPRGVDHALSVLKASAGDHVVTGSAAARAYLPAGAVPVVPLTTLVVHTNSDVGLIRDAGWRQVEQGANVLVVKPFDRVVLIRAQLVDGLRCAAPAQVVADLLTEPGRSSEEVEQLLDLVEAGA